MSLNTCSFLQLFVNYTEQGRHFKFFKISAHIFCTKFKNFHYLSYFCFSQQTASRPQEDSNKERPAGGEEEVVSSATSDQPMDTSENCAPASSSSEADLKIKEEEFSSDDNEAMAAITAGSEGDGRCRMRVTD